MLVFIQKWFHWNGHFEKSNAFLFEYETKWIFRESQILTIWRLWRNESNHFKSIYSVYIFIWDVKIQFNNLTTDFRDENHWECIDFDALQTLLGYERSMRYYLEKNTVPTKHRCSFSVSVTINHFMVLSSIKISLVKI